MRHTLLAIALLALLPLAGCRTARPIPPDGIDAVAAQQQRWARAAPASYTFTFERQCFCFSDATGPFVVTVERGAVTSVRRMAGGVSQDGTPVPGLEDTTPGNRLRVEDFFALLTGAYRDGAATVRATYDPRLGYPTSVWIDPDARMADEEVGYLLTNLRPL